LEAVQTRGLASATSPPPPPGAAPAASPPAQHSPKINTVFEGVLRLQNRRVLYAPREGQIVAIPVGLNEGTPVFAGQELLRLYSKELADEILKLKGEVYNAEAILKHNRATGEEGKDRALAEKMTEARLALQVKSEQLESLLRKTNSRATPGEFSIKSPINGILLSSASREFLTGRFVKPNESLLHVGATDAKDPKMWDWQVELRIPEKHLGQLLQAYRSAAPEEELDLDLLLTTLPTRTFAGKLAKSKIASQASVNGVNNTTEPFHLGLVRISGADIPAECRLPPELLLAGTEVRALIRLR
jgi:hypothetical protein